LIVVVPEAETAVSQFRCRLDPVAQLGVPAHVSVLFPFMPAPEIDNDVVARLAALFRAAPAFKYYFVRTDWFGDEVLWLAPDASEEFRSLTSLVWSAFPAYPPYEGKFDDVVPHLTIADRGSVEEMQAAEQTVQGYLPIRAVTCAVTLMVEQPSGRWESAESFSLSDQAGLSSRQCR
jgi:2'-5' RNA ligase